MGFLELQVKINEEITNQFGFILDWINNVGEISDLTNTNLVIQRKNFLIIGIYSTNEYLLEESIRLFFDELYYAIEKENFNEIWCRNEKLKIEKIIKNNHNGTKDGMQEMLSIILGNIGAKEILKEVSLNMEKYSFFCSELREFKGYRDAQTHSSKNFFSSDEIGIKIDVLNNLIKKRIIELQNMFHEFIEIFYKELNKLYKLK